MEFLFYWERQITNKPEPKLIMQFQTRSALKYNMAGVIGRVQSLSDDRGYQKITTDI